VVTVLLKGSTSTLLFQILAISFETNIQQLDALLQ